MKILAATFNLPAPAQRLRDQLEKAGVSARLHNESFVQRFVFWVKPAATQKVYVEPHDLDRARELADQWDRAENILLEAVHCPECSCVRIEYPQYTRKFIAPLIIELLISLGAGDKEYYCMDCHFTWPKTVKPEVELDVLGFPKRAAKKPQKGP